MKSSAQAAATARPPIAPPVNETARTRGSRTSWPPTAGPPWTTWKKPGVDARLGQHPADDARQLGGAVRRVLARLEDRRRTCGERARHLVGGHRGRRVPRHQAHGRAQREAMHLDRVAGVRGVVVAQHAVAQHLRGQVEGARHDHADDRGLLDRDAGGEGLQRGEPTDLGAERGADGVEDLGAPLDRQGRASCPRRTPPRRPRSRGRRRRPRLAAALPSSRPVNGSSRTRSSCSVGRRPDAGDELARLRELDGGGGHAAPTAFSASPSF